MQFQLFYNAQVAHCFVGGIFTQHKIRYNEANQYNGMLKESYNATCSE